MKKDKITDLRAQIVALSKDPEQTKKLLDQLSNAVCEDMEEKSEVLVKKSDIVEQKNFTSHRVIETKTGHVIHYKGGYTVIVDNKLLNATEMVSLMMHGPEKGLSKEDKDATLVAINAIDTIFRLPIFVFTNPNTTYTIAEVATRYMILLQDMGQVPTEDNPNPEYDAFLKGIAELVDKFAEGLEKEGREYEKSVGIAPKSE